MTDFKYPVKKYELQLINDLDKTAQEEDKNKGIFAILILFSVFIFVFLIWAYFSELDEITRGQGTVIPSSRDQIVQSLDPGIIKKMMVKEGDIVEKGQVLLTLDDKRVAAYLRESEAKVQNLSAMISRLKAEAYGVELKFDKSIPKELKTRETNAFKTRQKSMKDAVEALSKSKSLLDQEIAITKPLVKKGVVSQIELLKMQRQSADLSLQIIERQNKYKTDATNELVRTESELAQALENKISKADPVERSRIVAPVKGIVKNIRINTIGGVVQAGQEILEIVPIDDKLLVQAYISPKDVAFVHTGQKAIIKISAYDYAIYGGLEGKVILVSPDTLQDNRRSGDLKLQPDQTSYYRILVETTKNNITDKNGKKLDITPGMTATVDIKTGQKTVLQYLMKPIVRAKQALQER